MKLTKEAIDAVLGAYVKTTVTAQMHVAGTGEPIDHNAVVLIENDSDVGDCWDSLKDSGLALIDENDDPMTRSDYPFMAQLTHLGVLWCALYLHQTSLKALKVPGKERTVAETISSITAQLFGERKRYADEQKPADSA